MNILIKKRITPILLTIVLLLCGCASTQVQNDGKGEDVLNSDASVIEESTLQSDTDSTETDDSNVKKSDFPNREELLAHADGVEVSIFKDNTFDCDYSGYKEIAYDFVYQRRSVMAPEDWCSFRFYGEETKYENRLLGTPIYDRPLSVEINMWDDDTMFFNDPDHEAVFFLAEYPWQYAESYLNNADLIYKYDYEYYTDAKGRTMKVYFWEGLPKYAVYDNFFFLCIVFNLSSAEQIPIVVNMINSVEISLSSEAKFALNTAERLGYTIIPPEK